MTVVADGTFHLCENLDLIPYGKWYKHKILDHRLSRGSIAEYFFGLLTIFLSFNGYECFCRNAKVLIKNASVLQGL
jgi:hypothetical protein